MRTRLIIDGQPFEYKVLKFPGGEPHVELGHLPYALFATIDARVRDFQDFGEVLMLNDALKRKGATVALGLPYFPGARQDRVTNGSALTVKVYADIINAQGFENVTIVDPHSYVTPALINRCIVVDPAEKVATFAGDYAYGGVIAPDAGAVKRAQSVADRLKIPMLQGRKVRDVTTGALSAFEIEPLTHHRYLVVDDICDGGATFIGLANKIHDQWPGFVLDLWVTHGIFSKGLKELFGHYQRIGTTDSWYMDYGEREDKRVEVIAL